MTRSQRQATAGFTLIEVLAALAIASVVIVATAALIHNVALNFDRGTGTVGRADRLLLAVQRLSADFGSARLVQSGGQGRATATFVGGPTQVKFIAAGGVATGPQGEEVVSLTIEEGDGVSRLVRRRAPWRGPQAPFDSLALRDPVTLIDGRIDIAFAFARIAVDGTMTWSEAWIGQPLLPRLVRLTVRDRASGAELIPGAQFVLRADAPIGCAQPQAKATCLAGEKPPNEPVKDPPERARG